MDNNSINKVTTKLSILNKNLNKKYVILKDRKVYKGVHKRVLINCPHVSKYALL